MLKPKVSRVAFASIALFGLVFVAGCSGNSEPEPGMIKPTGSSTADPNELEPEEKNRGLTAQDVVSEQEFPTAGKTSNLKIYPLVRTGEYVVLTMDFTDLDDDDQIATGAFGNDFGDLARYLGVRLVDLQNDLVYTPAVDENGRNVSPRSFKTSGEQRFQLAYKAPEPEVDEIGLFLPSVGLIEDLPVIEGDLPQGGVDGDRDPIELTDIAKAEAFELESATRELEGAVETLTSTEEVVVTLGSDVLFGSDEDTLSKDAAAVVKRAAERLSDRAPGTISIVGHTDDIDTADYNQKLSERRAKAVAEELKKHIDVSAYPIETEGRGKSEPLVKNDSDENRATNRRVTLTLISEITNTTEIDRSGELPEFTRGPSATGAEGIEVKSSQRHWKYTATAREVHGHVVVDLKATALDDQVNSSFGIGGLASVYSYRPDTFNAGRTASGVQVMDGATVVYPMDHFFTETKVDKDVWLPLTDLYTLGGRIDGGQHQVFSIVYPRLGENWESVTIRAQGGLGVDPFELTDIPIDR